MARARKTTAKQESPSGLFRAKTSGVSEIDGEHLTFTQGQTIVRAGHPLLEAYPEAFEPADDVVDYDTETATNDPKGD